MGIMLILSQNVLPGVILKGHSNPELNNGISVYGMRLCSLNLKKGGGGDYVYQALPSNHHTSNLFWWVVLSIL